MPPDDHDHAQLQATLDEILAEQRKTNGRVGRLENRAEETDRVLYGDDRMGDAGLVASSHAADDMVRQWRNLVQVGKWVAATFGAASVGLAANLAQGLF